MTEHKEEEEFKIEVERTFVGVESGYIRSVVYFGPPYNQIVACAWNAAIRVFDVFNPSHSFPLQGNHDTKKQMGVTQLMEWDDEQFLSCGCDGRIFAYSIKNLPTKDYRPNQRFMLNHNLCQMRKVSEEIFLCLAAEGQQNYGVVFVLSFTKNEGCFYKNCGGSCSHLELTEYTPQFETKALITTKENSMGIGVFNSQKGEIVVAGSNRIVEVFQVFVPEEEGIQQTPSFARKEAKVSHTLLQWIEIDGYVRSFVHFLDPAKKRGRGGSPAYFCIGNDVSQLFGYKLNVNTLKVERVCKTTINFEIAGFFDCLYAIFDDSLGLYQLIGATNDGEIMKAKVCIPELTKGRYFVEEDEKERLSFLFEKMDMFVFGEEGIVFEIVESKSFQISMFKSLLL